MTALMVHEERAHPAHLNLIGELCAQLRRGVLALVRDLGAAAGRGGGAGGHQTHLPGAGPPAAARPSGSSSMSTRSTRARWASSPSAARPTTGTSTPSSTVPSIGCARR